MNGKKTLLNLVAILAIGAFLPAFSFAVVTYSAECAWTDSDLICVIYANTGGDSLISGAVALSYSSDELYDPDPADATKNEETWFFGQSTDKIVYMDPEIDTINHKIIWVVGRFELDASGVPTGVGVDGTRVEIGRVTLARKTADDPWTNPADPSQPVTFFGLSLSLGRSENVDYVNFVNTAGTPLDGSATNGGIIAAERGDANIDGVLAFADMFTIRSLIGAPYSIFADCNGDGTVAFADIFCVRNKL